MYIIMYVHDVYVTKEKYPLQCQWPEDNAFNSVDPQMQSHPVMRRPLQIWTVIDCYQGSLITHRHPLDVSWPKIMGRNYWNSTEIQFHVYVYCQTALLAIKLQCRTCLEYVTICGQVVSWQWSFKRFHFHSIYLFYLNAIRNGFLYFYKKKCNAEGSWPWNLGSGLQLIVSQLAWKCPRLSICLQIAPIEFNKNYMRHFYTKVYFLYKNIRIT